MNSEKEIWPQEFSREKFEPPQQIVDELAHPHNFDDSYHHDTMPHIAHYRFPDQRATTEPIAELWWDAIKPEDREVPDLQRFHVSCDYSDEVFATDNIDEAIMKFHQFIHRETDQPQPKTQQTGMTFQQKSIFMERLVDFALAARKLEEAWKDGGEFCTQYPFAESFDETFVKILEWQGQCAKELNAAQLVAANTPAVAILDITDNGMEFRKYCSDKAISYTILGTTFNGWSAEFRGSRLALEQMVADYWGDEDGTMGEQEKIQDVKGAQQ